MQKIIKLGDLYSNPKGFKSGRFPVYDKEGICTTILTIVGGESDSRISRR
jgi:hypothetical protein